MLGVVAALLVVAALVVAGTAVVLIRRPLPDYGGQARIDGLTADVEIVRDSRGVPQIYADDALDLFRAQGYVHAQDRFFEMDYRRRVTAGRLSELVGPDDAALASDTAARTLGLRRVAEAELDVLSRETRAYLEAYADGVNAYLAGRESSELAFEYSVLGLSMTVDEIEPWTPVDSLAWLKGIAWDLQTNTDAELERTAVYGVVGDVARVEELFPPYPEENGTILGPGASGVVVDAAEYTGEGGAGVDTLEEAHGALSGAATVLAAMPRLVGEGEGIGSNAWAVSGELTAGGRPLLAADPHYTVSAPGVLYQAGLHCRDVTPACPFDVAGFGYAGLPGILMGHNADLAWGVTALQADISDLFLERVFEDGTYVRAGQRVVLEERTETIAVNGSDDVAVVVRSTVHGPIVSDTLVSSGGMSRLPVPEGSPAAGLRGYAVSLAWTALTPGRTMDAILALDLARDAAGVAEAAAGLDAPAQGIVFATTAGQIGFQAAGRVPQRLTITPSPLPSDGSWPRPGWDPRFDWVGTVAPAYLPAGVDPSAGYVVAANQAVLPAGDGPFLTRDWDAGYRAQRIAGLLEAAIADGGAMTVADMTAIQADTLNPFAAVLLPYLLRTDVDDVFVDQGVELLRSWDGRQDADSAAAVYFASVWANVLRLTFWDDVPEGYEPDGGVRWLEVFRGLLESPQSPWWDDRTTINVVESRDEVLRQALTNARLQLTASLGKDPTRWAWGKVHVAAPQHVLLGDIGNMTPVRNLVNPRALRVDGGSATVRSTAWDAREWEGDFPDFQVSTAPSMRMVVDLADLDSSTWVNFTGNSGHPGSGHYTDQFAAWAEGRAFPWPFSEDAVRDAGTATRVLQPAD